MKTLVIAQENENNLHGYVGDAEPSEILDIAHKGYHVNHFFKWLSLEVY